MPVTTSALAEGPQPGSVGAQDDPSSPVQAATRLANQTTEPNRTDPERDI
jgi:hypothetical protein